MDEPEDGADLDGLLSAEPVREETRYKGAKPRATGHGGSNAALYFRAKTETFPVRREALREVLATSTPYP